MIRTYPEYRAAGRRIRRALRSRRDAPGRYEMLTEAARLQRARMAYMGPRVFWAYVFCMVVLLVLNAMLAG